MGKKIFVFIHTYTHTHTRTHVHTPLITATLQLIHGISRNDLCFSGFGSILCAQK